MDSTDDASANNQLDEKKQRKIAQMARREEERKLGVQTKQDERKLVTSTDAGRRHFEQEYSEMKNQLEQFFSQLSTNDTNDSRIQEAADRLQTIEKLITEHVDILRPRDVANAQGDVVKLRAQLNTLQDHALSSTHRIDFLKSNGEESQQQTLSSTSTMPTIIAPPNTVNLSNKHGEFIRFEAEELNGKDVAIENLDGCEVFLKGIPSSVQVKNLRSCVIITGPCSRSVMIDACHQCEFGLACQQLRVHTSDECDFYVHITAQPIIEDCHACRFAPYNVEYKSKQADIARSGLIWTRDYWNNVLDFNHMIPGVHSPNWETIEEEERKEWSLDMTSSPGPWSS